MKGIGPARLQALSAMGISSLRDLLLCLPLKYEDRTRLTSCAEAMDGAVLVCGKLLQPPKLSRFNGLVKVTAALVDESGKLPLVWYNQPWMMQQLPIDQELTLYGNVVFRNGQRTLQNGAMVTERCLLPVYKAIPGIPAKSFRTMMMKAL